ncbi:Chloroperoxidase [Chaetomium tenue]|uniref:Chloroperoxidase n=1 Tax=Chaetomium tenue TaxID=1854479 RepID=A0ACB7PLG4_9PEZI|nr:Chloroperoxidase [Chaetomium globosum]
MKTLFLLTFAAFTPVFAGFGTWAPPGPYDVRAPCPMLNTLANHGFLPHDGQDITREQTEDALFDALHIDKMLGSSLFDFAMTTNPIANSTTFSLNDLGNHNVLEHDGSLSRSDAYFGNALTFNQTVFDETKSYWTDEIITIEMASNARLARIKTSNATNPTYSMSELGYGFTKGESAAYVVIFGDKISATVPRAWVEWLFEHEQLPQHLGWKRPTELFRDGDLDKYMDAMQNTTVSDTPGCPAGKQQQRKARRTPSHFGW